MTTFTAQVSASGRDAQQQAVGNAAVINDATIQTAGRAYWGIAWLNVTIPQGSFIGRVIIETYGYTKYPSMSTTIYGEAANNATVYAATTNNLSNRTRTTANVAHTATYAADGWQSTVDLRAVVQEIVNRAGWASGNALSTIWLNNTASPGATATAYDGVAASAPKITIDYYSGRGAAVDGLALTTTTGTPTVTAGVVTATTTGIAVTFTAGTPTITAGAVSTTPTGIAMVATPGGPTVTISRSPVTVDVGAVTVTITAANATAAAGIVTATTTGVAVETLVGTATLIAGPITATTLGITLTIAVNNARAALLPASRNLLWVAKPVTSRWETRPLTARWTAAALDSRWTARKVTE